jgi:hypothetical protein
MDSSSSNHVNDIAYLYENIINNQINEEDIGKSVSDAITGKNKKPVPNPPDKGGVTVDAGPVKIGVTDSKTDIGKQTGDAIVRTAQGAVDATQKAAQAVSGAVSGLLKGSQPAAAKPKPTASAKPKTVAAAGGKGGSVTVGKEYDAKLGGQTGKVTYDAKGQKTFKPSAPATAKTPSSSTAPSAPSDSWKPKTKGEAEWAKNFPKLAARLNPNGTQRGTGQSKMEKDVADLKSLKPETKSAPATAKASPAPSTKPAPAPSNDDLTDADKKRIDDFKKLGAIQKLGQRSSVEADLAKMTPSKKQKVMDYYNQNESYDAYDLVLEYLFTSGHVDTVDEAHYVMMEMDSETIGNICEAKKPKKFE